MVYKASRFEVLLIMSTGRRIGMALLITPIQTAGLNQVPSALSAHGTAIWNTIRQVAGAVGTSLLVTVMTSSTNLNLQVLMSDGATNGETQQQLVMAASIQGVNDAYLVIIMIGIISLILSFFIKHGESFSEDIRKKSNKKVKRQVISEA